MRSRGFWPALIIGSAALVAIAYAIGLDSSVRAPLALWFLLVCPGMAWVRFLPIASLSTQLSVAVALSVAFEIIAAALFLYMGAWSTASILAVTIAAALGGAILQLRRPPQAEPLAGERT
jgi:hypothetical protein